MNKKIGFLILIMAVALMSLGVTCNPNPNTPGAPGKVNITPPTAAQVDAAVAALSMMDTYYDKLVAAKAIPDNTGTATLVLGGLDIAAQIYKAIRAGQAVSNADLNQAALATKAAEALAPQVGVTAAATPVVPANPI